MVKDNDEKSVNKMCRFYKIQIKNPNFPYLSRRFGFFASGLSIFGLILHSKTVDVGGQDQRQIIIRIFIPALFSDINGTAIGCGGSG